jgi:hypothetical protein
MRWSVVLVGCSFEPRGVAQLPEVDAAVTVCRVGVESTTGTVRGRVGGNGGAVQRPPLACDANLRPVGLAVRMSDQVTNNGGFSAHGLSLACAEVTVDSTGAAATGSVTMVDLVANGGFGWTPSTEHPPAMCRPGWIMSGLAAHTGSNGNLFLDLAITCGRVGPVATEIVETETIAVPGSLAEPQGPGEVHCGDHEVVVRIPNRVGAGIDSVELACSPIRCE